MDLFIAIVAALSKPTELAAYSLAELDLDETSVEEGMLRGIDRESSFIARSVRDMTIHREGSDSSNEVIRECIRSRKMTRKILLLLIHLMEAVYSIGLFVRFRHDLLVPTNRHEVCIELACSESGRFAVGHDEQGRSCWTPLEKIGRVIMINTTSAEAHRTATARSQDWMKDSMSSEDFRRLGNGQGSRPGSGSGSPPIESMSSIPK